jgi:hypothetical protein
VKPQSTNLNNKLVHNSVISLPDPCRIPELQSGSIILDWPHGCNEHRSDKMRKITISIRKLQFYQGIPASNFRPGSVPDSAQVTFLAARIASAGYSYGRTGARSAGAVRGASGRRGAGVAWGRLGRLAGDLRRQDGQASALRPVAARVLPIWSYPCEPCRLENLKHPNRVKNIIILP